MQLKLHSSLRAGAFLVASSSVLAAFVVACSPDFSGFGFGFSGSASSGGAGTPPTGAPAAKEPPELCDLAQEGSTCIASVSAACESGDAANATCNVMLRCGRSSWERDLPRDCALECPRAFTVDASDLCDSEQASTLLCEYAQGTCGCAPEREPPDGGDAGEQDAGAVEDAGGNPRDAGDASDAGLTHYVWKCVGLPEPGCPKTRPRLGSACVKKMTCDYGACVFDDGLQVECRSGRWDPIASTCRDR